MNKSLKDLKQKLYQCRYCGLTKGTYTGALPMGQCPARKKHRVYLKSRFHLPSSHFLMVTISVFQRENRNFVCILGINITYFSCRK